MAELRVTVASVSYGATAQHEVLQEILMRMVYRYPSLNALRCVAKRPAGVYGTRRSAIPDRPP